MTTVHIETKNLPSILQRELAKVEYKGRDICVEAKEKAYLSDCGSDGRRAFVVILNMTTGESRYVQGSWGGPNMFSPTNPVDLDDREYPIPPNGAVIRGSEGYGGVRASIFVHPSSLTPLLPAGPTVTDREKQILGLMGFNGKYKGEEMRRANVTQEELKTLADKGLIKVNKAGATSITTAGKNAIGRKW
jgi:hypothetical protein